MTLHQAAVPERKSVTTKHISRRKQEHKKANYQVEFVKWCGIHKETTGIQRKHFQLNFISYLK